MYEWTSFDWDSPSAENNKERLINVRILCLIIIASQHRRLKYFPKTATTSGKLSSKFYNRNMRNKLTNKSIIPNLSYKTCKNYSSFNQYKVKNCAIKRPIPRSSQLWNPRRHMKPREADVPNMSPTSPICISTVSYTHLTLPTIYSV